MRLFTWGHRQEPAPELPLYEETPADRYGRMKATLERKAAGELREGTPEMDLYRQFRLASYITAGQGTRFSNMDMSAEQWQKFVEERPHGLKTADSAALNDLMIRKLAPQGKAQPYEEAIRTLNAYLIQNKQRH